MSVDHSFCATPSLFLSLAHSLARPILIVSFQIGYYILSRIFTLQSIQWCFFLMDWPLVESSNFDEFIFSEQLVLSASMDDCLYAFHSIVHFLWPLIQAESLVLRSFLIVSFPKETKTAKTTTTMYNDCFFFTSTLQQSKPTTLKQSI